MAYVHSHNCAHAYEACLGAGLNTYRAFLAYKHDGDDCNQDEAAADNADDDTSCACVRARMRTYVCECA